MPAIVDPDSPGSRTISVFEFGVILLYLRRKFRRFYRPTRPVASRWNSRCSGGRPASGLWPARRITFGNAVQAIPLCDREIYEGGSSPLRSIPTARAPPEEGAAIRPGYTTGPAPRDTHRRQRRLSSRNVARPQRRGSRSRASRRFRPLARSQDATSRGTRLPDPSHAGEPQSQRRRRSRTSPARSDPPSVGHRRQYIAFEAREVSRGYSRR